MRKFITFSIFFSFMFISVSLWAQTEKVKGASKQAYGHASGNAVFNRVSDWFATIGKSKEEKEKTLEERRVKREAKWAEKEAKRAKKKAEKDIKGSKKKLGKRNKALKGNKRKTNSNAGSFFKGRANGKKMNK